MPTETAAWLASSAADLTVGPAPRTAPRAGEVAIRVRAVAINPLDTMKQHMGDLMYRWLPHPAVLGEDVAGVVEEVGPGVTRFAVGDRVVAYAVGMEKGRRHQAEGGFQTRVVVRTELASPIPDAMRFEDAAVLPLGISTAASGLFGAGQLGLRIPDATTPSTGETVVVWGGSTSVGMNAIQLAVAAGYDVVTTASPRNHELVRSLGASRAFDYRSPTAVRDIKQHLAGRRVAGALRGPRHPTGRRGGRLLRLGRHGRARDRGARHRRDRLGAVPGLVVGVGEPAGASRGDGCGAGCGPMSGSR